MKRKAAVALFAVCTLISSSTAGFAQASAQPEGGALQARIQRVENGIPPIDVGESQPLQLNLQKLMELYKVPALSIAVIDDFKIAWTKAYGVTEAGANTPVTVHTLFQAGSISKPVSATGALYLVEHGKLSLDENVNKQLKSWQLPDNDFTKDQKVTLRRLLSHSGGLTIHGFPGYEVGKPMPTVVQVLNGEPPANTAPVRVDTVPGTRFIYSGGGVTIEQLLITDVTGESFPKFMHDVVLSKIGMNESTFDQPLSPSWAAKAASGTHGDGTVVPGKWHIYPEMAAAGLWTTPTDLAKFAVEIALSKHGKANHVLSEKITREMLTPQIDQAGLGFAVGQYKNPQEFGHDGADEGFQAVLAMLADSGKGVAIMANSDNGISVMNLLMQSVAKEYGWSYTPDPVSAGDVLTRIAKIKGSEAVLTKYAQLKKSGSTEITENTLIGVGYTFLFSGQTEAAIQIFKQEVQDYPKYWNAYDSLGEALLSAGQKDLAIQNYEKSVELNPKNQSGIDHLKELKTQK